MRGGSAAYENQMRVDPQGYLGHTHHSSGGIDLIRLGGVTFVLVASGLTWSLACGSSSSSTDPTADPDAGSSLPPPVDPGPPALNGVPTVGVFVQASAPAGGIGTKLRPLNKLSDGVALAKQQSTIVNVCAESYEEALTLADGVSLYGYFTCADGQWARKDGTQTQLRGTITAEKLNLPTRIEGFAVTAPDAPASPQADTDVASIALVVRDVTSLSVSESSFRSGAGTAGVDGANGATPAVAGETAAVVGRPTNESTCTAGVVTCNTKNNYPGGAGATRTCATTGASNPGGAGGAGLIPPKSPPYPTTDGYPEASSASSSAGERREASFVAGPAGGVGVIGSNGAWKITADGFVRGNGVAGGAGTPGGGGGGSAGSSLVRGSPGGPLFEQTASGSGGGAGGCPGIPGTPGTGGGASVAAFVSNSTVKFENSKLTAGAGGRGGNGQLGSAGGMGSGGAAGSQGSQSAGRPGGPGGDAGLSGHGAPGPSLALAYKGKRPETVNTTLATAAPAQGSAALTRGAQSLDATVGVASNEYAF